MSTRGGEIEAVAVVRKTVMTLGSPPSLPLPPPPLKPKRLHNNHLLCAMPLVLLLRCRRRQKRHLLTRNNDVVRAETRIGKRWGKNKQTVVKRRGWQRSSHQFSWDAGRSYSQPSSSARVLSCTVLVRTRSATQNGLLHSHLLSIQPHTHQHWQRRDDIRKRREKKLLRRLEREARRHQADASAPEKLGPIVYNIHERLGYH